MNNNSLLSQAAIELEEAVHQILSFQQHQQHQHQQHSHHHQYSRRNRNHVRRSSSSSSCLNAYERTRMVRRVQRSLVALENVLLSESANDEDDQHDDNVDDNVVHIDDHDDDHIDDHDDVLIIDGHIDGHIHNEYQQHQHRQYYDDDYDQIQYDPQPTTTTTTHSPTNDEDHHHQNGNDSIENNKKKKNITLDDSLLHLLIDILTELPKKVTFSSSSSASSSSASSSTISTVSTSSSSTSIFIINDDLYQTISETTCRIIQQYAPLPLHTIHIDKLLDRLANIIIGRSSCSSSSQKKDVVSMVQNLNIIQIMNTSLLAQDGLNQQQHQQQQQQKQQQDDIDDDDDGIIIQGNSTLPFLLNLNETLVLTQLLIPLSLKHLANSWEFIVPTTTSTENNVSHEIDNNINAYDGDNIDNCDEDDVGFDEVEQQRQQHIRETDKYKEEKHLQQESEVQLRVLLGYIFRHLTILIQQHHEQQEQDRQGQRQGTNNRTVLTLEDVLYLFLHTSQEEEEIDDHHHHHNDDGERKILVEDYIDLISSFLIENIQYAIDIIDASSHYLRQFIGNNKTLESGQGFVENYEQYNQQQTTIAAAETTASASGVDIHDIRRYVKDTIRHCSLAVGMMEMLYEDLGLHSTTSFCRRNSSHSHSFDSFYKAYADFIACFCTDQFLNGGLFCRSDSRQDVQAIYTLFDSADNVLFRLSDIVRSSSSSSSTSSTRNYMDDDDDDDDKGRRRANRQSKRRRIDGNNNYKRIRFMDSAAIITLLRAYHNYSDTAATEGYHYDFENQENEGTGRAGGVESILRNMLRNESTNIQCLYQEPHYDMVNDNYSSEEKYTHRNMDHDYKAASNISNLVHACALSTLIFSDAHREGPIFEDSYNQCSTNEETILASLVSPLMTMKDSSGVNTERNDRNSNDTSNGTNGTTNNNDLHHQETPPCPKSRLIDTVNPWSYLLGAKLSESFTCPQDHQSQHHRNHVDTRTNPVPAAVSTSSVSSVSDLKSHVASVSTGRSVGEKQLLERLDGGVYNKQVEREHHCKYILSDFVKAVPSAFHTLED